MIGVFRRSVRAEKTERVRGKPDGRRAGKTLKKCLVAFSLCFAFAVIMSSFTGRASAAGLDTVASLLEGNSESLQVVLLLTVITLLPTLLIMLTGFTRIIIVLSMVRNAIGLQNMPPNSVLIGLSLFITYFVMTPVIAQIGQEAYTPYTEGEIELEECLDRSMDPLRDFMFKQTYQNDLEFFSGIYGVNDTGNLKDIPNSVVIVSFITSELKHAFAIGFFLYIPFIVIDMIVSSTLMSMGMMMLPPAMISMPFKILLFVLVDGWQLTIGTIISSFAT